MRQALRAGIAIPRRPVGRQPRHLVHGRAELFVGNGFRYWLTGFRTGDLSLWERAFQLSSDILGIEKARDVCSDFSQWVRVLAERSRRNLEVLAPDSPRFCRDECVAIALIAAYQHKACPALQACAMTLLDCEPRGDVAELSSAVADRLKAADQHLSEKSVEHVVRYAHGHPGLLL